ncbi:MAG: hypothetical protein AAF604_08745 [Acidobacteriota bacterium]
MNSFEAEIQRLRSAVLTHQANEPGPECPSSEEIWRATSGELAPARGRAIVEHALGCRACSVALEVANDLVNGANASDRPAATNRHRSRLAPLVAAAALALMVVLLPRPWHEESASRRGTPLLEESQRHSERLPRNQAVLRWRGDRSLGTYGLRARWLSNDSAGELWNGEAIAVQSDEVEVFYRVAPQELSPVPDGARLYWTVEVMVRGTPVRKTFSAVLVE